MGQYEGIAHHIAINCSFDGPIQPYCPDIMVQEVGPCETVARGLWAIMTRNGPWPLARLLLHGCYWPGPMLHDRKYSLIGKYPQTLQATAG